MAPAPKRGMDAGGDPAEVFSRCQDHVIGAARAHVDRIVLEAFLDKRRGPRAGARRARRSRCCATSTRCPTIEADRGWFLEHGRLSNARSKAVTATVNERTGGCGRWPSSSSTASGSPREMLRAEILEFSGS